MNKLYAPLFEFGDFYTDPFSNVLYEGGYTYLGLSFILIPLIIMAIFYYVWNPIFGRWYHWLLMIGLAFLLTLGAAYGIVSGELVEYYGDPDYSTVDYYTWNIIFLTAGYSILTAIIWSFIIRFRSSNNRTNPIAF